MGRFSFGRRQGVVFTASDNSDANTNGRTYWAVLSGNTITRRHNIRPRRPAYASLGALTQEGQTTGKIIEIDQDNGKITLEHKKVGTAGGCAADKLVDTYNIADGLTFSDLKIGAPVVFTEARIAGVWTVTRIQKQ
jgi:Cu/Ag efflux protein CusF